MVQDFGFDVFLSHNSKDKPRVRRIAEKLKAAGLRVWFDEWSIAPGEDIYLAIERGLESSRTLLLFLSSAALGSEWVGLERSTALFRDPTNKARRFVPVLLEDCKLPDALQRYRYIDLSKKSDTAFAALLAACTVDVPPPPAAVPAPPRALKKRPRTRRKPQPKRAILPFALLSGAGFLAALVVLWLMLDKAALLARFGLSGQLFYVTLLPLALSAAAFLFGALRSVASYRGQAFGGVLEMGGPVVLFCMVMLGGFKLVPPTTPFAVTVFVHGPSGVHDLPLRDHGSLWLDLGADRRSEPIGEDGQSRFVGIPATLRGQEVGFGLEAEGFSLSEASRRVRLDSEVVYLAVDRLPIEVRGRVLDEMNRPVEGASVAIRDRTAVSGKDGAFAFEVPGDWSDGSLPLSVVAFTFEPWRADFVPRSNDIDVVLRKERP